MAYLFWQFFSRLGESCYNEPLQRPRFNDWNNTMNEYEIRVMALFVNPEFKKAVTKKLEHGLDKLESEIVGIGVAGLRTADMPEGPWDSDLILTFNPKWFNGLHDIVNKHIFSMLPPLPNFVIQDVLDSFLAQLGRQAVSEISEGINRVYPHILSQIGRTHDRIEIAVPGDWGEPSQDWLDEDGTEDPSWGCPWSSGMGGFVLNVFWKKEEQSQKGKVTAALHVSGATPSAISQVEARIYEIASAGIQALQVSLGNTETPPSFSQLISGSGRRAISSWIDTYYSVPKKKCGVSKLEQKIRHAISFVASAISSEQPALRLVFSMTSIECLLCNSHASITDQISRRASALLLKPVKGLLRSDAMDSIGKLYAARSRFLHGDKFEVSEEEAEQARRLASGVIIATLQWKDHVERVPEKPTFDAFIKELKSAERDTKEMVGVEPELSRALPNNPM